ncbi:MAG: hypothetical protein ACTSW2_05415 [Alphaproteobacteria bacterium]
MITSALDGVNLRAVPTAALIPLASGYKVLSVEALDPMELPEHWH